MRAILFGMAVTVLIWFALIVVHDYGQYKYKTGMKKCSCDTTAILEKERTKNDILKSKSRRR